MQWHGIGRWSIRIHHWQISGVERCCERIQWTGNGDPADPSESRNGVVARQMPRNEKAITVSGSWIVVFLRIGNSLRNNTVEFFDLPIQGFLKNSLDVYFFSFFSKKVGTRSMPRVISLFGSFLNRVKQIEFFGWGKKKIIDSIKRFEIGVTIRLLAEVDMTVSSSGYIAVNWTQPRVISYTENWNILKSRCILSLYLLNTANRRIDNILL